MATWCAQIPIRPRGNKKCTHHHGKDVVYFCETCTGLVCGECVIDEHKGHVFAGIETVVQKAKAQIEAFINNLEEIQIQLINGKIVDIEFDMKKNREHYKQQIQQIRDKNETVKAELDTIADMMVQTCQIMEDIDSHKLLNHKQELCAVKRQLNANLQEFTRILPSEDNVVIYDASKAIPAISTDLPKPKCKEASFTQGKFSLQQLEDMIGELHVTTLGKTGRNDSKYRSFTRKESGKHLKSQQYKEKHTQKVSHEPKFQALTDFIGTESVHASFQKSDVIDDVFIIDKNWMEGTITRSGRTGRFLGNSVTRLPTNFISANKPAECRISPVYKALHRFDAKGEKAVSFVKGDVIEDVSVIYGNGWMEARVQRTEKRGWVPSNHVVRILPHGISH